MSTGKLEMVNILMPLGGPAESLPSVPPPVTQVTQPGSFAPPDRRGND